MSATQHRLDEVYLAYPSPTVGLQTLSAAATQLPTSEQLRHTNNFLTLGYASYLNCSPGAFFTYQSHSHTQGPT